MTMRRLVVLAFVALSGCTTLQENQCQQPPSQLLVRPQPLSLLPDKLSQQQAITEWLNDMERYNILRRRYEALQKWGETQCWGKPNG